MKVSGRFLIDTNVIVNFFKGDQSIATNLAEGEVFMSSVVIGELYFGAYASGIVKNREKRLKEISYFLENYPILEIDEGTSDYYGQIKSQLKASGNPIPENDIWIAAMARQYGLTLVTRDGHFKHIDKFETLVW